jgi:hypothetical protein
MYSFTLTIILDYLGFIFQELFPAGIDINLLGLFLRFAAF